MMTPQYIFWGMLLSLIWAGAIFMFLELCKIIHGLTEKKPLPFTNDTVWRKWVSEPEPPDDWPAKRP